MVCKLNKSLYGLKQAGRQWYSKIDHTFLSLGFRRLESDHCIYVYHISNIVMYIALYVDDLLIFSNNTPMMKSVKSKLSELYHMKDLGEAKYILGMQISRDRSNSTISLRQTAYIESLVERFGQSQCKNTYTPMDNGSKLSKADAPQNDEEKLSMRSVPYQSAVGAIMYCMLGTRPDIAYAITALSQYNSNYGAAHWNAVKRVIRYLNTTKNHALVYGGNNRHTQSGPGLFGYCDADWGNHLDDRRSFSGYSFIMAGGAVSWSAKKQSTVALSTMEAEYMAATEAAKEAMWWRNFLRELGVEINQPTIICCDNQGAIQLAKNPALHPRSKHIDIRHHFIREVVANKIVELKYISTEIMGADILTKAVPRNRHQQLIKRLGVMQA